MRWKRLLVSTRSAVIVTAGVSVSLIKDHNTLRPIAVRADVGAHTVTPNTKDAHNSAAVVDYENRIRMYSSPNKIFRYFASKKSSQDPDQIYMTINDFVCSYMLNRVREKKYDLNMHEAVDVETYKCLIPDTEAFLKVSKNGLLSYYDFLFLMTILSTNEEHLEVVFNTIDVNNDDIVTKDEFINAFYLFLKKSAFGEKQGQMELESLRRQMHKLSVVQSFFGSELDKNSNSISKKKMVEFFKELKKQLTRLEFNHFRPVNGKISEEDFAMLIVSSSKKMASKWENIKHRVCRKYEGKSQQGVSFEDYNNFCVFLNRISLVQVALDFCRWNSEPIDKRLLKHIIQSVADVDVSDHAADVIFTVFDVNDDQSLSNAEFYNVLRSRADRGLSQAQTTGLNSLFRTLYECAKNAL